MPKSQPKDEKIAVVNVYPERDGSHKIEVCFRPDPIMIVGEGESRALLALDASASFREVYGVGSGPFAKAKENNVERSAGLIGKLLCEAVKSQKATGIYWAVSPPGDKIEEFGEHDADGWTSLKIRGPVKERWGQGTHILPVLKYACEKIAPGADWTMAVIITDGKLDDEQECIQYCVSLCAKLVENKKATGRDALKFVLIGVGDNVDREQFERLDDLGETHGLGYDLWSTHPNILSMQDAQELLEVLYGELMTETVLVAESGQITDGAGKRLRDYSDGLPGRLEFVLPKGEKSFVIVVGDEKIRQDCSDVIN